MVLFNRIREWRTRTELHRDPYLLSLHVDWIDRLHRCRHPEILRPCRAVARCRSDRRCLSRSREVRN